MIGGAHSEQRLAIAKLAELDRSGTSKTPWKIVADSILEMDPYQHGVGSTRDQAYAERADVWSFYLAAFGDPEFAAK